AEIDGARAATSGCTCVPAGTGWSGKFISFAHVACRIATAVVVSATPLSSEEYGEKTLTSIRAVDASGGVTDALIVVVAGVGSVSAPWTAATLKVWVPLETKTVYGDVHANGVPPSTAHWKVIPSLAVGELKKTFVPSPPA